MIISKKIQKISEVFQALLLPEVEDAKKEQEKEWVQICLDLRKKKSLLKDVDELK